MRRLVGQCMYKTYESKLTATDMKMLRMSAGVTKLDRIRSTKIRGSLRVKDAIVDKLHHQRVNWYCHVRRRPLENVVQQAITEEVQPPVRRRGRKKHTWIAQMESQQRHLGLSDEAIKNRATSRRVTRSMANPT